MKTFYVSAESTDWCGVSVDVIVEAPDDYTERDIEFNEKIIAHMDEGIRDFVDDDRFRDDDDDEANDEANWTFASIEETTDPEIINCKAYDTISLIE